MVVDGGVEKSPGIRVTLHRDGHRLELVQREGDRETGCQERDTSTEQGVLQPGPSDVWASAPGGTDSS